MDFHIKNKSENRIFFSGNEPGGLGEIYLISTRE